MSFSHLSRRSALALRTILGVNYFVVAVIGGVYALIFTPQTTQAAVGSFVVYTSTILAIIGGFGSIWGVTSNRWDRERIWVAFAVGGAFLYAGVSWYAVVMDGLITGGARAGWATVALGMLVYRHVELMAFGSLQKRVNAAVERATTDRLRPGEE